MKLQDLIDNKNYLLPQKGHVFTGAHIKKLSKIVDSDPFAKIGMIMFLDHIVETDLAESNPLSHGGFLNIAMQFVWNLMGYERKG